MQKPKLIAVVGAPLAGKTTISKRLSQELGCFFQDTDELRIKVFGWRNHPKPDPKLVDLTSLAEKNKTERHATSKMLLAMVRVFLEEGESIIISARSIGRPENMSQLQDLVRKTGADIKVIRCMADGAGREEIERRLAVRTPGKGYDASIFVTYEQYLWILKQREGEEQGEQPYPHILINTMKPLEECVAEAINYIRSSD